MSGKISISELFSAIDRKDADAFVACLTEDAVFRYGSQEPVRGRDAVRDYVAGFLGTLEAIRHQVLDVWEHEEALVCRGDVTYRLQDGREVTVPFANILTLEGDKVLDYRIYIDPTPLAG
jgi:ketosteroid isomerase-like protein